jgi:hypothetical protein
MAKNTVPSSWGLSRKRATWVTAPGEPFSGQWSPMGWGVKDPLPSKQNMIQNINSNLSSLIPLNLSLMSYKELWQNEVWIRLPYIIELPYTRIKHVSFQLTSIIIMLFIILIFVVLGFERKALQNALALEPLLQAFFAFSYFSDRVSHFCPCWTWTLILPICASGGAGIKETSHGTQLLIQQKWANSK